MKKLISLLLLVSVVLSMTGCCCVLPFEENKKNNVAIDRTYETFDYTPETEEIEVTEDIWVTPTEEPYEIETAEPTEPPVTENLVSLSANDTQRKINTFLSNFAETYMYAYPCSDYEMLQFAYVHALINGDGKINKGNANVYMSEKDVDSILVKYFGTSAIESASSYSYGNMPSISYDGSNYYYQPGAGESYALVAIATKMVKNGSTYTVSYSVFMHDEFDAKMDTYYKYTYEQAVRDNQLLEVYTGTAVVKDYERSAGNWSYQLIQLETYW